MVARVNAEFDFSQKKSTKETFDPNNVVRSEQNLEEKKKRAPKKQVGGVPGVVSNIGHCARIEGQ
ncbi:flagellar M-ring protein FliF C-terminal domain-containing protein [Helicobacter pylori]